ncbi:transporter substrate-binding domain-containing protein [Ideonella sp. DXS22W]|uniref:Transporter substrate-binding domain-containing protein n=1 Tax=Pseudaquabacterium inlustre TaxID=2984192 RepID=A0ABU9CBS7_9BURK
MTQRDPAALGRRQLLAAGAAALATTATPLAALAQDGQSALARIRARGTLTVGLYHELPPFHVDGKGIEVEMANALAQALGVKASLLPFHAGENMDDDLRNMVWKGHYLGWGPADVLLHVPVDRPLMLGNPKVQIFAPYFRERVMIARDLKAVPKFDSLDDIAAQQRIAVPGLSLAGWLLIGADGGKYRERLVTKLKDGCEAARALAAGEVAAAAGHASELESVLGGDPRFSIEPLPIPRGRDGWAVGCAVKKESEDLAQAVQAAMNGLATSGELKRMFNAAKVTWRQP